jgi:hypothetical protein
MLMLIERTNATGGGCWDVTLNTPGPATSLTNAKFCKVRNKIRLSK